MEQTSKNTPYKSYYNGEHEDYGEYYRKGNTYYKKYDDHKFFSSISTVNEKIKQSFSERDVWVTEMIDGRHIQIFFDGKETRLYSKNSQITSKSDYFGFYKIFSENYELCFLNLRKSLWEVPFSMFGVLLTHKTGCEIEYLKQEEDHKLIFHDIYLNSNWMNYDDLLFLLGKVGFLAPPILFRGVFDFKYINNLRTRKSLLSGEKQIKGLVIRPELEDEYRASESGYYSERLITKITNSKKKDGSSLPLMSFEIKKHPARIASDLLKCFVFDDDSLAEYWLTILNDKGIQVSQDNYLRVFDEILEDSLVMLEKDIEDEAVKNSVNVALIKNSVMLQIPYYIEKHLGLKKSLYTNKLD